MSTKNKTAGKTAQELLIDFSGHRSVQRAMEELRTDNSDLLIEFLREWDAIEEDGPELDILLDTYAQCLSNAVYFEIIRKDHPSPRGGEKKRIRILDKNLQGVTAEYLSSINSKKNVFADGTTLYDYKLKKELEETLVFLKNKTRFLDLINKGWKKDPFFFTINKGQLNSPDDNVTFYDCEADKIETI